MSLASLGEGYLVGKEASFPSTQVTSPSQKGNSIKNLRNELEKSAQAQCSSVKFSIANGLEVIGQPPWVNLTLIGLLVALLGSVVLIPAVRKPITKVAERGYGAIAILFLILTTVFSIGWFGHQFLESLSSKAKGRTSTFPLPARALYASPSKTEAGIDLAWTDNSSNEDGFRIERMSGGDSGNNAFEEIAVLEAGSNTYRDMDIKKGLNYTYRIKSFNSKGSSLSPLASANAFTLDTSTSGSKQGMRFWPIYGFPLALFLLSNLMWFWLWQLFVWKMARREDSRVRPYRG